MSENVAGRTMSLVDAFLDKYENGNLNSLNSLHGSSEYISEYLSAEDSKPLTKTEKEVTSRMESLLDAFLSSDVDLQKSVSEALKSSQDVVGENMAETSNFEIDNRNYTETLARIYLKQRRYDKALEIIRSLYLNFPNKNIYFADQIRFLEILVRINQNK
mgnify:FL=1